MRAVIQAVVLDGLSAKEAAQLLHVPVSSVKTRLYRAKAHLRARPSGGIVMTGWHLDDDVLQRYVERTDSLAEGASAEQHLLSCEPCRARVNAAAGRHRGGPGLNTRASRNPCDLRLVVRAYHRAMTTPQEVLAGVPLFSMLPEEEVATLARRAHEVRVPAGTVVTDMDTVGVSFGVIVDGRAAVSVHGKPVRVLGAGDYFGEMALIDETYRYRSATITAETELHCLMFAKWGFRHFAMSHPQTAWALLEMMAQRVREAESR